MGTVVLPELTNIGLRSTPIEESCRSSDMIPTTRKPCEAFVPAVHDSCSTKIALLAFKIFRSVYQGERLYATVQLPLVNL